MRNVKLSTRMFMKAKAWHFSGLTIDAKAINSMAKEVRKLEAYILELEEKIKQNKEDKNE